MAKVNLASQREIGKLAAREAPGFDLYYDSELRGFGLKVFDSGRRVWFVEFGPRGRRRRMTLGDYAVLTPTKAREKAREELGKVAGGRDPLKEKQDQKRKREAMPTFAKWAESYLAMVAKKKKQPRSDRLYLNRAVKAWGRMPLNEITTEHVSDEMKKEAERGNTTANRWLASVRACFTAAWRQNKVADNPAARVDLLPENPARSRMLSDEEMRRLLDAVSAEPSQHIRAAFRLLLETGARTSEVTRAKWADMDLDNGEWRIPSPKAGYPQVVPLQSTTVGMLRRLEREGEYVIPGRLKGKPRHDLRVPWERLKAAAELPEDVRIHDIRRTFGRKVERAAGLHVASRLLRHSDTRVTEKVYAKLDMDDLRKGLEKAKPGQVVPFEKAE